MKSYGVLVSGSVISGLFGLLFLYILSTKFSIDSVGLFQISKDFSDTLLKFLLASQVSSIVISAFNSNSPNASPYADGILGACALLMFLVWLVIFVALETFFPAILDFSLGVTAQAEEYNSYVYVIRACWFFCFFYAIDLILSQVMHYENEIKAKVFLEAIYGAYICMATQVFVHKENIEQVAVVFFIGALIKAIFKAGYLQRKSRAACNVDINAESLREIKKRLSPYYNSVLAQQLYKFIFIKCVSTLPLSVVGIYYLAYRIYTAIQSAFTVNLINYLISRISRANKKDFWRILKHHLAISLLIIIASYVAVIVFESIDFITRDPYLRDVIKFTTIMFSVAFFFDGVSYLANTYLGVLDKHSYVARITFFYAGANCITYPVYIYLFDYHGILIANVQNCVIFSGLNFWRVYWHLKGDAAS